MRGGTGGQTGERFWRTSQGVERALDAGSKGEGIFDDRPSPGSIGGLDGEVNDVRKLLHSIMGAEITAVEDVFVLILCPVVVAERREEIRPDFAGGAIVVQLQILRGVGAGEGLRFPGDLAEAVHFEAIGVQPSGSPVGLGYEK